MAIIDNFDEKLKQAKMSGFSDEQIFNFLKNKGVSPDEIIKFTSPQTEKRSGILGNIGGFLGETTGIIGIGRALKQATTTNRPLKEILPEAIGSAAKAGLTLGTLGAATLGIRGAASIGAGFTAAESLERGTKPKPSELVTGAALGGAVPIIGKSLSGLGRLATERLPKRLIQSAIGQSKKELLAGKDISEFVLKNRKIGTADRLIQDATLAVQNLGKTIQKNLESVSKKVFISKNELLKNVASKINEGGGIVGTKEVSRIINGLAPQARRLLNQKGLTLSEANKLRQSLDKTLGDRGFLTSQLPFNKEILRSFSNELRERVKTLAPGGTRELFNELSKEITLRNALLNKYAGQARNQVINAFDLIVGGGGFLGGGIRGAIGAFAVKKGVQSPLFKTGLGVKLGQVGVLKTKLQPILKKLVPAERAIILNLIGQASSSENQNPK